MREIKARGIVLSLQDYKEADKLARILLEKHGKINVLFRGIKKPKAKLKSCANIMFFGEFELVEGKGAPIVTGVVALESFFDLASDYDKYLVASRMLGAIDKLVPYNTPCDDYMILLLRHLSGLIDLKGAPEVLYIKFLINIFESHGNSLSFENKCIYCNKKLVTGKFFSFVDGGASCLACGKSNIAISDYVLTVLRQIADTPIDRLHTLHYDERLKNASEFLERGFLRVLVGE